MSDIASFAPCGRSFVVAVGDFTAACVCVWVCATDGRVGVCAIGCCVSTRGGGCVGRREFSRFWKFHGAFLFEQQQQQQQRQALQLLQPEDIAVFSSRFFRAVFAEVLVAGNVTREQAEATGAKLLQTLNAHPLLPDEHIVSSRCCCCCCCCDCGVVVARWCRRRCFKP